MHLHSILTSQYFLPLVTCYHYHPFLPRHLGSNLSFLVSFLPINSAIRQKHFQKIWFTQRPQSCPDCGGNKDFQIVTTLNQVPKLKVLSKVRTYLPSLHIWEKHAGAQGTWVSLEHYKCLYRWHTVKVCWGNQWQLGFNLCSACLSVHLVWPCVCLGHGRPAFQFIHCELAMALDVIRGWSFHTAVQRPRCSFIERLGTEIKEASL